MSLVSQISPHALQLLSFMLRSPLNQKPLFTFSFNLFYPVSFYFSYKLEIVMQFLMHM